MGTRQAGHPTVMLGKAVTYVTLIVTGALFAAPFLWMVSTSLRPDELVFSDKVGWIPNPPAWSNYSRALHAFPFVRYLANTLFITLTAMVGQIMTSSMVAYSFARLRWPGRDVWFLVLLSTMMLPSFVTLVPQFIIFKQLGWLNTYYPLIIPYFLGGGPFSIFLLRQYFLTIPQELSEAARLDGASNWGIYYRLILPLAGPALAAVAIFGFIFHWNEFTGPLVYLNKRDMWTLSLGLISFRTEFGTYLNQLMAASIVILLPVLALFFGAQRYFIQGIALSGLKG